ncbi:MAG: hypothetical protein C5B52_07140 [Bacteroidetes bacterium]|nr:MAG: hypothetical protein C5B52_07140 [Bacteroidota bacterium]
MKIKGLCILLIGISISFSCNQAGKEEGAKKVNTADSASTQELEAAIRANPDSVSLRFRLVNEFSKQGKIKEAVAETDSLIAKDSTNAAFWYKRGALLMNLPDTNLAITAFKRSIALAPMFMEPRLDLASIYASRNNALALVLADQVLHFSEDPRTQTQARYLKGLYYSNNNENQKALQEFDTCIVNDYTFLEAYTEKGLILYDQKEYANALKVFEKAMVVSNTYAEAYFQAGRCELALGNKEEANQYFQKAAGLDKSYKDVVDTLLKKK